RPSERTHAHLCGDAVEGRESMPRQRGEPVRAVNRPSVKSGAGRFTPSVVNRTGGQALSDGESQRATDPVPRYDASRIAWGGTRIIAIPFMGTASSQSRL